MNTPEYIIVYLSSSRHGNNEVWRLYKKEAGDNYIDLRFKLQGSSWLPAFKLNKFITIDNILKQDDPYNRKKDFYYYNSEEDLETGLFEIFL